MMRRTLVCATRHLPTEVTKSTTPTTRGGVSAPERRNVKSEELIKVVVNAAPHHQARVVYRSALVCAAPEHTNALNAALGSSGLYEHFERMIPSTIDLTTRHAVVAAAVALSQRSKISDGEFAILTYAVDGVM